MDAQHRLGEAMMRDVLTALCEFQARLQEQSPRAPDGLAVELPEPWWTWLLEDVRAEHWGMVDAERIIVNLPCGAVEVREAARKESA